MMRSFSVIDTSKGLTKNARSPYTTNPLIGIIYNNFEYANPLLGETNAKKSELWPALTQTFSTSVLNKNLYRIFYPTKADLQLQEGYSNPWQVKYCAL
jgi:hypothetical protein